MRRVTANKKFLLRSIIWTNRYLIQANPFQVYCKWKNTFWLRITLLLSLGTTYLCGNFMSFLVKLENISDKTCWHLVKIIQAQSQIYFINDLLLRVRFKPVISLQYGKKNLQIICTHSKTSKVEVLLNWMQAIYCST